MVLPRANELTPDRTSLQAERHPGRFYLFSTLTAVGACVAAFVAGAPEGSADIPGADAVDPAGAYVSSLPADEAAGVYAVVRDPAAQALSSGTVGGDDLLAAVVTDALAAGDRVDLADVASTGQLLQVDVMRAGATDAYGVASLTASPETHTTGEGWFFLAAAYADGGGWQVELETEAGFVDLVAASTVLSEREQRLLTAYATATPDVTETERGTVAKTKLMLPWQQGASWTYSGGPHGFAALPDEPRSSLDLSSGGGGEVLAAGSGVAAAMCASGGYRGWIRVVHPNGLSTDYYHLIDNVTPDGDPVRKGAYLGIEGTDISCDGSAANPHVHFSLGTRTLGGGGDFIAIQGNKIGGWTFWNGTEQYEGTATHGGTTVGTGQLIKNYGSKGGGGGGDDPPTRAEVWTDGDRVNLRSGPGTDYDIVGSKADGDVIKIECTARGTMVEGMDGPTDLWDKLTNGKWISDGFVYTGTSEPVEEPC